jgi:hypothetical protein
MIGVVLIAPCYTPLLTAVCRVLIHFAQTYPIVFLALGYFGAGV